MNYSKKQRRARRSKPKNWEHEIAKGNTDAFYKSTDWDILREKALIRDNFTCQFFMGLWTDGKHKPTRIEPVKANTVHHIISIKERPDLCLDIDNVISLSFDAHELIEGRNGFLFKRKKKLTKEMW
ncbi:hypothetical protein MGH68_07200 [Erysipelothrix sp. D19-032]|uniref:HNH endonuclease n=1 Tax=Erysipelothrix anatis TaxID=2683713 RepID=UPI00135B2F69|nr:HNH endonuclease [Erysipelothrix anatis]